MTDEELVKNIQKGNTNLFAQIIERYQSKLQRYVSYLTNGSNYTEDIVQEAFIKAYVNINSFNDKYKFSSWMYRITHNEAINKALKFKLYGVSLSLNIFEDVFKDNTNVEEDYEKEEMKVIVQNALDQLPLKYKEVLLLYYIDDKSYDEISDILHISIGTVGTLIFRGKKQLKSILEKKAKEENDVFVGTNMDKGRKVVKRNNGKK